MDDSEMYISSGFLLLLLFLGATSFSSLFFWLLCVCVCVQPVSKRITTGGRTCSLTFLFARFLFLKGHVCVRPAGGNEIVSVCLLFPFRLSLSLSHFLLPEYFSRGGVISARCVLTFFPMFGSNGVGILRRKKQH